MSSMNFVVLWPTADTRITKTTWAQQRLHIAYFWFQVVFVILVSAVGQSTTKFIEDIVTDPDRVLRNMAASMPHVAHFYMNFLMCQLLTHAMNMTRSFNLLQYLTFRTLYSD